MRPRLPPIHREQIHAVVGHPPEPRLTPIHRVKNRLRGRCAQRSSGTTNPYTLYIGNRLGFYEGQVWVVRLTPIHREQMPPLPCHSLRLPD